MLRKFFNFRNGSSIRFGKTEEDDYKGEDSIIWDEDMTQNHKMDDKKIGIIRVLQDTYGFIADNEIDRFFHWSYMDKTSMKPFHRLEIGDRVSFIGAEKDGKPQAMEVAIVPFEKQKRVS